MTSTPLLLPRRLDKKTLSVPTDLRQLTILGGNGAGKSRFMEELIHLCGAKAYCVNVLAAFYAPREESTMPGSIDTLYRDAIRQQSYMRADAVSQLDKLLYLLFSDELEHLFELKEQVDKKKIRQSAPRSKLDKIKQHWEAIFPGNHITVRKGHLMFGTRSGSDLISADALSRGEKAVLYYLGVALFAPAEAVIFVDSPTLFIQPAIIGSLWNTIEELRSDCMFVYNSVDEDFVTTRTRNTTIRIRRYDSTQNAWDYTIYEPGTLTDELLAELGSNQRRVLFIEGDMRHSIDRRLYSLVFPEMNVRPLGSCNKVIETTRSMNDQHTIHHLHTMGIVDRDRRNEKEVEYLRSKQIMVPDVAEIENIFMLPGVMKLMAVRRGLDGEKIFRHVRRQVVRMFRSHLEEQALQHVRHRVKREVECRIDARFKCITALETHLQGLATKLQPRHHYNSLLEEFTMMVRNNDYESILRVFNHKPMLPECGIHQLLGYRTKEDYISGVLEVLKADDTEALKMRNIIRHCLHAAPMKEDGKTQHPHTLK